VGEGALPGGSRHLAGREADDPVSRRQTGEHELLIRLIFRSVHHGRYAGTRLD